MASRTDWQVLDEEQPARALPTNRFKINQGKERFMAMVAGGQGRRRWTLMRFPLADLAGKGATAAQLHLPVAGLLENADRPLGGSLSAHLVVGPDRAWDQATASRVSRDGRNGWIGGAVRADERAAKLRGLLTAGLPPAATLRVRRLLEPGSP